MSSPSKEIYGSVLMLEDLMEEILSKLSVKSLIRFRCVCKLWYALIKSPHFISKHHKNYNDENTDLIISYELIDDYGRRCALSLFHDRTLTNLSFEDFQTPKTGTLYGPYEGIFCLCKNNRVTLWNPATREYRNLPKCNIDLPPHKSLEYINVVFGLDPISNDYKLVLTRTFWDDEWLCLCDLSVAVYTLSNDTWRFLKENECNPYHLMCNEGTYLNGVFYWLTYEEKHYSRIIVSFHMNNEKFQEIPMPNVPDLSSEALGLFNDSLTLLVLDWSNYYLDMWTMKDNIWVKQLTVGPVLGVRYPVGFWKNNGLFLETKDGMLLLYDLRSNEVRDLGPHIDGGSTTGISLHCYKESLARIKGDESLFEFFDIPWHVLGVY